MVARGYQYKRIFSKFLPDSGLLLEVSFRPVKDAFREGQAYGHAICLKVYYPRAKDFFLVSPDEFRDLRKDGTLRHVCYTTETSGIYSKAEGDLVSSVLERWFDFWEEKLSTPRYALEILTALRGRAPFPAYLSCINEYVAKDEADKVRFEMAKEGCVWPFDGGINLKAYVAFLISGGLYSEATSLITDALDERYFKGVRFARVVMDDLMLKLQADAMCAKVKLSEANIQTLKELGHLT
ncbi:hypothetical protein EEB15_02185 [Ramlibacter sp. WS9]|nr:hypothetical protein EEB15_02185 [Ramlibacter sp. WS9]